MYGGSTAKVCRYGMHVCKYLMLVLRRERIYIAQEQV